MSDRPLSRRMALLIADEVRKAHPELDVYVIPYRDGSYAVKVSDRCELVMKFDREPEPATAGK